MKKDVFASDILLPIKKFVTPDIDFHLILPVG